MTRADSQSAAEHQQAISTHLQADHQHDTVPPPSLMPDRASNAQSLPMEDEKEDPGVVDELTNTEAQLESGRASDGPNLGPDLSTIRTVLLGAAMTLTFVLGVSIDAHTSLSHHATGPPAYFTARPFVTPSSRLCCLAWPRI